MADKFDELVAKKTAAPEPNVDGSFDCQVCDECVGGAYFDNEEGKMSWVCSQGHRSSIKVTF